MADTKSLSINNVRVSLGDIPSGFSPQLKEFFVKQPNFNDSVISRLNEQDKLIQALQQETTQKTESSAQTVGTNTNRTIVKG
jgi:hypothetical protein